jgi:hypothetical protein
MTTIGVIWVGYNCADTLEKSLGPWESARRSGLGRYDYAICAVSVPFEGFDCSEKDETHAILERHRKRYDLDHVFADDTPVTELVARTGALRWQIDRGADVTVMVDADEFYTPDEIERITSFVAARPQIAAFKGSLKNYVEASGQRGYLADPFTPMRIHRVRYGTYVADHFWADNNVMYRGTLTRDFKRDIDLPVMQIPRTTAFVHHESWPNSPRSQKKIKYQLEARGWPQCSFAWDESKGGLIFNPNLPEPEIVQE